MLLKLDPSVPIAWRNPHTIQLGIEYVYAVLDNLSTQDEQFIWLLKNGIPVHTVERISQRYGLSAARRQQLLTALSPALREQEHPAQQEPPNVVLNSKTTTEPVLLSMLTHAGWSVHTPANNPTPTGADRPHIGLLINDYVTAPRDLAAWQRDDLPHTKLTFTDQYISWGPIVTPASSACLLCPEYRRAEHDPCWPAIASQLVSMRAPTRTTSLAPIAYAMLATDLTDWHHATTATATTSTASAHETTQVGHPLHNRIGMLDRHTRRVHYLPAQAHPDCGCGKAHPRNVANTPGARHTGNPGEPPR